MDYEKIVRRNWKALQRHKKLQKMISEWFRKLGYEVLNEWFSIDVVAYKMGKDDVEDLTGAEVKTWLRNPTSQFKKANQQARKFKKIVDKFYVAFWKSSEEQNKKIDDWIGIINVGSEPFIVREARYERVEDVFPAVNWWKRKYLLRKFRIKNAYTYTTKDTMREVLEETVKKDELIKALRIAMISKTPDLEDIKEQISKPKSLKEWIKEFKSQYNSF